ncbi:hypothetical protein SO802_005700 [Lithocarpus litseifolius]|uniref:Reverse transcriptase n=1 Tax=Lithocarpus litseifolius TaxID=425828 RepID=A0AAW2DLF0_9ROSI
MVRSKVPTVLFLMETKRSISEMRKFCYDLNFQSVLAVLSDGQSGGLGLFWKAGDYNEILHSEEKQGGSPKPLAPMLAFKETLLQCGLEDLSYHGYPFTWRNGRPSEAFVEVRLDRVCASTRWQGHFPSAKVSHLHVSYSDHDPILLDTQCGDQHARVRRKRLNRFEEQWAAHQECDKVIREAWNSHPPGGSLMFKEEVFWRQWSRAIWLPAGDKNTNFFHKRASKWQRKNQIDGLMDKNGFWRTDEQSIGLIAAKYFNNIFATSNPRNMEEVLNVVDRVVTEEMNQSLLKPFVGDEVRQTLFQMHPSKSPGLDGMSSFFFQKYWHVVGRDVTEAVLSVLNSGHVLTKMNFTHILLIPKKKDP